DGTTENTTLNATRNYNFNFIKIKQLCFGLILCSLSLIRFGVMSIYYSGTFTRSAGVISAIIKQLKLVNLKPVKKIQVQFDPFHPNAVTARDFLFHISSPKVTETNLSCVIRANVVCDRSEPEIKLELADSGVVKFLANNLTVLDILQQINKHISSKVKEDPIVPLSTTKIAAKKLGRR
ncbi:unnamed protein product, partial [Phaedon cochleariae]